MRICPVCGRSYADDTLNFCLDDGAALSPQRRRGRAGVVMGAAIVVLSGAVLVLGYVAWRGSKGDEASGKDANAQSNKGTSTPTPPVISNVNVNAGTGGIQKPTGDQSPQWLYGVWEGTGQQHTPKMTWTIKLTAESDGYTIEYPSLRCGGRWNLVEADQDGATFKEVITRGQERCSSDGDILVEKLSDRQLSYKYTLPVIGEVATATLNRR